MTEIRWARRDQVRSTRPPLLEADVVDERVMIRDTQAREPIWGPGLGRIGRRVLFATAAVAILAAAIPLAIVTIATVCIGAFIARRVLARRFGVDIWAQATGRSRP